MQLWLRPAAEVQHRATLHQLHQLSVLQTDQRGYGTERQLCYCCCCLQHYILTILCSLQDCAAQRRLQKMSYSSSVWQASVPSILLQYSHWRRCLPQHSSGVLQQQQHMQHPACTGRQMDCEHSCCVNVRRGQGVSDVSQQQYQGPPPVRQLMEQAARQWQVRPALTAASACGYVPALHKCDLSLACNTGFPAALLVMQLC
jgi:hypothetical protein